MPGVLLSLRPFALALGLGVSGGLLAFLSGVPLPWMLGPMLVSAFASIAGAPVRGPARLRPFTVPVIGVFLGSGFSPELVSQLGNWSVTLAILVPYLITAAFVAFVILRRWAGYDAITAFYAAMPGGLTDMVLMGDAAGGDAKRIALCHAVRVFVVIIGVALYFGLVLGVRADGSGRAFVGFFDISTLDAALLLAAMPVGAWLGRRVGLPAPDMLGPMVVSAILHLIGAVHGAPPSLLVILAQIVMGTMIGCRFIGTSFQEVGKDLLYAALVALALLCVAMGFAALIQAVTGTAITQAFLAASPGGLTEMSLLAFAMGQEVAYVSVAHVARIALVIFGTPLVFRFLRHRL